MNKIIIFLIGIFCSNTIYAIPSDNQCRTIVGRVVCDANVPVGGASVFLIDSMTTQNVLANTITDEDGRFSIESSMEYHVLGISCLGYKLAMFDIAKTDSTLTEIGDCVIEPTTIELQTVIVKGHPIRVKSRPDGFSVNVSDLALSSNNALDLLGRLPNIAVRGNQIKVIGKENIILSVNNVIQRVNIEQLPDVLRGYDATLISSIDIITAPSAKYNSDGMTAMIILHMDSKFNKYAGGNIGSEVLKGTGYDGRYGIYGSMVYNNNKLFIDVTPSYNYNYSHFTESSSYKYEDGVDFISTMPSRGRYNYLGAYATIQYQCNNNGYIGINCNINNKNTNNNFNSEEILGENKTLNSNKIGIKRPRINAIAYTEYAFSKTFTGWLELSYYNYQEGTDLSFSSYNDINGSSFMQYISNQELKVDGVTFANDYSKSFCENNKLTLDFGLKAYYAKTHNLRFNELLEQVGTSSNQKDNIKINETKINPYFSLTYRPTSYLYFRLGLQLSNTLRTVNSGQYDGFYLSYTNLLPDFIMSWTPRYDSRLSFVITSGCTEPKFNQINPFEWRLGQHIYGKGNLNLKNESTYNYKLTYTYKGCVSISCYASMKKNEIVSVSDMINQEVYTVAQNAQNRIEYGIRPSYYFDRLKWIELSAEVYCGYGISNGLIPEVPPQIKSYIWGGNVYGGFVFNKTRTFTGYINVDYTGRRKNAVASVNSKLDISLGASYFLLDRKLCVSVSGLNILSSHYKGESYRNGYTISFDNRYEFPTLYISVSYKFNNLKDSSPKRNKLIRSIDTRM